MTFGGSIKDLKVHIYDVRTVSQADQFVASAEAPASYAERKRSDPRNIRIRNRASEVRRDTNFSTLRIYIDTEASKLLIGKAKNEGENMLRGTGTMHVGHAESPRGRGALREH